MKAACLLLCIFCFAACSEKDEETEPVGSSNLQVTPRKLTFTANGGTQLLQVKTTYQYYGYNISPDWLSGDFKDDPNYNYVAITAQPNTSTKARTATIRITGGNQKGNYDETVNVAIEQEGRNESDELVSTTVNKAGGQVNAEDLTADFPANTFDGNVTVSVAKEEAGSIRGDQEVSPFYKMELPVDTKQSFKVSIKADKQDNVQMIAHASSVALGGEMQQGESDVTLETSYVNGAYVADIPAFDNKGESGKACVSFGLIKKENSTKSMPTRGTTNSASITFHLDWARRLHYSLEAAETIENAARDAINTILALGFKLPDARNIPIVIKPLSDEGAYGYFMQSAFSEKWSTIEINDRMVDGSELRQTVFHEMLHYFQSAYDPRCCFSKYRFVYRDLLMLTEAGGVWIEKLAGNGPSPIMINNAGGVLRSFDPIPEVYKGTKDEGREFQSHGYGLGIVLEYLSQEEGNNSIVKLYQAQKEGASTTKECVKKFAELAGFDFFYNYEDFALKAVTGQLVNGFGLAQAKVGNKINIHDDKIQKITDKVFKYGTCVKLIQISKDYKDSKGTNSMKDKVIYAIENNPYVHTTIFMLNKQNPKGKELGDIFQNDEFVFDDEKELERAVDSREGATYIYLVTTQTSNLSDSQDTEIDLALTEMKIPNITKFAITYGYNDTKNSPHYLSLPKRSANSNTSGSIYFEQWAPCTTRRNISDKTITITSQGSMTDYENYQGEQSWDLSFTIDVKNWGLAANGIEEHEATGSFSWQSTGKSTGSDWTKRESSINFRLKKVTLINLTDDDAAPQVVELGQNFSRDELFSSYTETDKYTFYTAPHGDTPEKYEYRNDSYSVSSNGTIPFSIYLWVEDD